MNQYAFKPVLRELLHQAQIDQNAFFQNLTPAELATTGTPEFWAAKDHLAHMTFWRQRLVLRVQAIIRKKPQSSSDDFEQLNPVLFEKFQFRQWPEILSESDHVYAELITLTEQLPEEDLTAFNRFDWTHAGTPLYTSYMGYCYEHTQQHLVQYLLDRHEFARAVETYEAWASRVIEAEVPEPLKGSVFYNLACFYATHSLLEKATPALQQAFTLYPATREFARTDPDLLALRVD